MGIGTIYLVCAIAGGAILVIKLILMVIGLDHSDASPDVTLGADLDHDGGLEASGSQGGIFNFLSIQSIAGFFTMFGLVGLGLLQVNASNTWSLIGALGAGLVTAWCTGLILIGLRKLHSEGTLAIENAVGRTGTVYLTVPEQGTGVVNITVQGAQRSLDAVSESGKSIPTGSLIKVTGIAAGHTLIVSELNSESKS